METTDSNFDRLNENHLVESIKIYKEFKNSIINWPKTKLQKANKFINKCVANQLDRLNSYGLSLETFNNFDHDIFEGIDSADNINCFLKTYLIVLNNSNQTFTNQSFFVTGTKLSKYYKNGRLIKKVSLKNRMYVTVTDVNDDEEVLKYNISCPNCGNILPVSQLVSECSYCNTKFSISDLYPIVTNYYHNSMKKEQMPILKYYIIITLIMFLPIMIFYEQINVEENLFETDTLFVDPKLFSYITLILSTLVVTLLITIFIICIRQFVLLGKYSLLKKNKKDNYLKLENFMRAYDPNFTYYMFEGKIISMLKEVIFSKNPNDLVICDYDNKEDFSNIIDANFFEMYIKNMYVKDNLTCIDLKVEMDNTLYINNKIKQKRQTFFITVARKCNVKTISKFRIDNLNCKSCGAIIDIEKDKCCNYCQSRYDFKDYDFVFTRISVK